MPALGGACARKLNYIKKWPKKRRSNPIFSLWAFCAMESLPWQDWAQEASEEFGSDFRRKFGIGWVYDKAAVPRGRKKPSRYADSLQLYLASPRRSSSNTPPGRISAEWLAPSGQLSENFTMLSRHCWAGRSLWEKQWICCIVHGLFSIVKDCGIQKAAFKQL